MNNEFFPGEKYALVYHIMNKLGSHLTNVGHNKLADIHDIVNCDFYYQGVLYNHYIPTANDLIELPESLHKQMDSYLEYISKLTKDLEKIKSYLIRAMNISETISDFKELTKNIVSEFIHKNIKEDLTLSKDIIKNFHIKNRSSYELLLQYKTLNLVIGE